MPQSLIDLAGLRVGAEEFLSAALEATEQPIWVVDPEGVIRFANPAAITALGYERVGELLGRRSHETIHHAHPDGTPYPAADCPMLLPRTTGETVSRDLDWFFRRDGSMFPVSYVSAPIEMHDGRGAVVAFTDIEDRVRAERALREHEAAMAGQQVSLRRVATLVAGGAASDAVFAAIAREVGNVIGLPLIVVWRYEPDDTATVVGVSSDHPHPFQAGTRWPLDGPTITAQVLQTGRPVRIDDWSEVPGTIADAARDAGITGAAGAPIVVDGDIWGAMSADSTAAAPMPDDVEDRLVEFTELIAAAFATTARQEELARLADEQAALRRVATMVAQERDAAEVFAAVAEEVGRLLAVEHTAMLRYEDDGRATIVASWGELADVIVAGIRLPVDGDNIAARVRRTERPARIDDYRTASGSFGTRMRELGIGSAVGCPIVVDGRLWGTMITGQSQPQPLPVDTESRVAQFTELIATAISNLQARAEVARLVDEQTGLRRVATLVAQAVPSGELFDAVVEEVGTLLRSDLAGMIHYENDGTISAVAVWAAEGEHPPVEGRWSLEGDRMATTIFRTRRPTREDEWDKAHGPIADFVRTVLGIHSSVGSPIIVEGRVWGAVFVHSKQPQQPLPPGTETRLTNFAELVATAVSNTHARGEVGRLAEEQTALRRVATLVAEERPPAEVFASVAEEVGRLLRVEDTRIIRYEPDESITVVANWGKLSADFPVETRMRIGGDNVATTVYATGRPSRKDSYEHATGPIGDRLRELGVRSVVGTPIIVQGRLWGAMLTGSLTTAPLPEGIEARIAQFTDLVATAISNIEARSELAASRARIVAAADEERRQVVRDLHDGAQQRLVHTVITLKLARRALEKEGDLAPLLTEALDQAERATNELRELSHGVLPAVLVRGGLRAGIEALASRTPVPVDIAVSADRLPAVVEATGYFVVAEALTNVAKHARATRAEVTARVQDGTLWVRVRDDGAGGAQPTGIGLRGLADRVAALEGRFRVESPEGGGTVITADIPLRS
jgi:PAS domain S-box-containing protein